MLLGTGSFANAWLVREVSTQREYVMKSMIADAPEDLRDVTNESEILSCINHPNVIRYKEVLRPSPESLVIIMEYADDGDVLSKLNQARTAVTYIDEETILAWLAQCVNALAHLHSNGIIHRDVKTANMFLTKEGVLKLGDFGGSRHFKDAQDEDDLVRCRTAVGSPMYMAPEIVHGVTYGPKTDIWSLGCAAFEMTTLEQPFNAQSYKELAVKIKSLNFSRALPSVYSEGLRELIRSMLSGNIGLRPSSSQLKCSPFLRPYCEKYDVSLHVSDHQTESDQGVRYGEWVNESKPLHHSTSDTTVAHLNPAPPGVPRKIRHHKSYTSPASEPVQDVLKHAKPIKRPVVNVEDHVAYMHNAPEARSPADVRHAHHRRSSLPGTVAFSTALSLIHQGSPTSSSSDLGGVKSPESNASPRSTSPHFDKKHNKMRRSSNLIPTENMTQVQQQALRRSSEHSGHGGPVDFFETRDYGLSSPPVTDTEAQAARRTKHVKLPPLPADLTSSINSDCSSAFDSPPKSTDAPSPVKPSIRRTKTLDSTSFPMHLIKPINFVPPLPKKIVPNIKRRETAPSFARLSSVAEQDYPPQSSYFQKPKTPPAAQLPWEDRTRSAMILQQRAPLPTMYNKTTVHHSAVDLGQDDSSRAVDVGGSADDLKLSKMDPLSSAWN